MELIALSLFISPSLIEPTLIVNSFAFGIKSTTLVKDFSVASFSFLVREETAKTPSGIVKVTEVVPGFRSTLYSVLSPIILTLELKFHWSTSGKLKLITILLTQFPSCVLVTVYVPGVVVNGIALPPSTTFDPEAKLTLAAPVLIPLKVTFATN